MALFIGCAGWNLRKEFSDEFSGNGTHLERYAQRFNAVEINSSFYRPHRISTYQRWADATPNNFRFTVKLPKQITHIEHLVNVESLIETFVLETKRPWLQTRRPCSSNYRLASRSIHLRVIAFFSTIRQQATAASKLV